MLFFQSKLYMPDVLTEVPFSSLFPVFIQLSRLSIQLVCIFYGVDTGKQSPGKILASQPKRSPREAKEKPKRVLRQFWARPAAVARLAPLKMIDLEHLGTLSFPVRLAYGPFGSYLSGPCVAGQRFLMS